MNTPGFFKVLQTTSSEVSRKNLFNTRSTAYVPDLFVVLFCTTLFSFAVALDIFLLFCFIINSGVLVITLFTVSLIPHSVCEFLLDGKKPKDCLYGYVPNQLLLGVFYFLGFGAIFTGTRILTETFEMEKVRKTNALGFPYAFFHISDENLSCIKFYCCIHLVLKSIPQLFIMPVFILGGHITGALAITVGGNIMLNIAIFCQTIAMTFPIRKTPRVFTNSVCILLNAFDKFMATMCACCIHLTVFAVVFKRYRYYALLAVLLKLPLWALPCWRILKALTVPISKVHFSVYFIFICLVFSFVYVHPFEGLGKLYYYLFYLLGFLYELLLIFLIGEGNLESVSYFLTLKLLMFGFLSCFGLLNILHKYREIRFGVYYRGKSLEVLNIEYKDAESSDGKEGAESGESNEGSKTGKNKNSTKTGKNKNSTKTGKQGESVGTSKTGETIETSKAGETAETDKTGEDAETSKKEEDAETSKNRKSDERKSIEN